MHQDITLRRIYWKGASLMLDEGIPESPKPCPRDG